MPEPNEPESCFSRAQAPLIRDPSDDEASLSQPCAGSNDEKRGHMAPAVLAWLARSGLSISWSSGNVPSAMTAAFDDVYSALRQILKRHAGTLSVKVDSATCYCLEGGSHPKHKTPMPIAWVQIGKAYVSFHHMGVCSRPDLLKGDSKRLKARMQGKSCFNFTSVDPLLFAELEDLTVRGFDAFRNAGFMK